MMVSRTYGSTNDSQFEISKQSPFFWANTQKGNFAPLSIPCSPSCSWHDRRYILQRFSGTVHLYTTRTTRIPEKIGRITVRMSWQNFYPIWNELPGKNTFVKVLFIFFQLWQSFRPRASEKGGLQNCSQWSPVFCFQRLLSECKKWLPVSRPHCLLMTRYSAWITYSIEKKTSF